MPTYTANAGIEQDEINRSETFDNLNTVQPTTLSEVIVLTPFKAGLVYGWMMQDFAVGDAADVARTPDSYEACLSS